MQSTAVNGCDSCALGTDTRSPEWVEVADVLEISGRTSEARADLCAVKKDVPGFREGQPGPATEGSAQFLTTRHSTWRRAEILQKSITTWPATSTINQGFNRVRFGRT